MIRINKDIALNIIIALKSHALPAYTNWVDYAKSSAKDYVILDSGYMSVNTFFKRQEFYFFKRNIFEKNQISYGIVFHIPDTSNVGSLSKTIRVGIGDYAEIAIIKHPVLEPSGIGELVFQNQSISLDKANEISVLNFLESDIPDNIKDIFLFNINEF